MEIELYKKFEFFLPERVFDAHIHVGRFGEKLYTADDFLTSQKEYFPDAEIICGNLIPLPDKSLKNKEKRLESVMFIKDQLELFKNFCGEVIVLPGDTVEDIEKLLVHPRIRGLKCYHVFADREDVHNADIEEFLPEAAWKVAEKNGMCITLHLVKEKALADSQNLKYIKTMAEKYPKAKLILSHCARGFASWTLVESVKRLRDHMNVYFDVSSVCESPAIHACIRTVGTRRVLWGSDYFVSDAKGKCVSFGDGFVWITEEDFKRLNTGNIEIKKIQVESLYALMQACHMLMLTKRDMENVFYYNALNLFSI